MTGAGLLSGRIVFVRKSRMPDQVTSISVPRKGPARQRVVTAGHFVTRQPAIESLREKITARWLRGALTLSLSKEFECRREFIEAVARDGASRIIGELRAEIERSRRAA